MSIENFIQVKPSEQSLSPSETYIKYYSSIAGFKEQSKLNEQPASFKVSEPQIAERRIKQKKIENIVKEANYKRKMKNYFKNLKSS